ncbi:MAG: hypothetical protein WC346_18345 [Methanogenium sp.]|jgi:E3 ubiquitin-protein ligase DOA10
MDIEKIKTYIEQGIKQEVEKEFDALKDKLIKDLEMKKNEICAGILLNIMKTIDIQNLNDRVIFTIREIK